MLSGIIFVVLTAVIFIAGNYLPYRWRRNMGVLQPLLWLLLSLCVASVLVWGNQWWQQGVESQAIEQVTQPPLLQQQSEALEKTEKNTEPLNLKIAQARKPITMRARANTYIRHCASTECEIIASLRKGDVLKLLPTESDWWQTEEGHFINTLWLEQVAVKAEEAK